MGRKGGRTWFKKLGKKSRTKGGGRNETKGDTKCAESRPPRSTDWVQDGYKGDVVLVQHVENTSIAVFNGSDILNDSKDDDTGDGVRVQNIDGVHERSVELTDSKSKDKHAVMIHRGVPIFSRFDDMSDLKKAIFRARPVENFELPRSMPTHTLQSCLTIVKMRPKDLLQLVTDLSFTLWLLFNDSLKVMLVQGNFALFGGLRRTRQRRFVTSGTRTTVEKISRTIRVIQAETLEYVTVQEQFGQKRLVFFRDRLGILGHGRPERPDKQLFNMFETLTRVYPEWGPLLVWPKALCGFLIQAIYYHEIQNGRSDIHGEEQLQRLLADDCEVVGYDRSSNSSDGELAVEVMDQGRDGLRLSYDPSIAVGELGMTGDGAVGETEELGLEFEAASMGEDEAIRNMDRAYDADSEDTRQSVE